MKAFHTQSERNGSSSLERQNHFDLHARRRNENKKPQRGISIKHTGMMLQIDYI